MFRYSRIGNANKVVVAAPPSALKIVLLRNRVELLIVKLKKMVRSSLPMPVKTACGKI